MYFSLFVYSLLTWAQCFNSAACMMCICAWFCLSLLTCDFKWTLSIWYVFSYHLNQPLTTDAAAKAISFWTIYGLRTHSSSLTTHTLTHTPTPAYKQRSEREKEMVQWGQNKDKRWSGGRGRGLWRHFKNEYSKINV